jgi:hypothetical protein
MKQAYAGGDGFRHTPYCASFWSDQKAIKPIDETGQGSFF